MAAGALPFRGESAGVIFDEIMNRAQTASLVRLNPDVPAELERIIDKALPEKDRSLRYQHASDMRSELTSERLKRDSGFRSRRQ